MVEKINNISAMFDRIAGRYDLLNKCLSFSLDARWRKKVGAYLPSKDNLRVLDIATGTGDLAISLLSHHKNILDVIGIDISPQMMELGREKIKKKGLENNIQLEIGDAMEMRFLNKTFDVVTIAFGIRNVSNIKLALSEIYRVLKPGGKLIILEFSLPRNRLVRACYLFYFRYWLPFFGGLISGDLSAYRYLNQSVEQFPYGEAFKGFLREAGFLHIRHETLTFGVTTIYTGEKDS